jgi:putative methionine-R-sulfoxide reductase with GAF domain
MSPSALEAIDGIVDSGNEADDVLRGVVGVLVEQGGCAWAGILFAEQGELVLGPQAGEPDPGLRVQLPVIYEGTRVAELVVDGCNDTAFLNDVADRIATHCLVGWDTSGAPWEP